MLRDGLPRRSSWLFLILAILLGLWPAAAETRYILSTDAGTDTVALAARYQLRLVRNLHDGLSYTVSADLPLPDTTITSLVAEPGVRSFEPDAVVHCDGLDRSRLILGLEPLPLTDILASPMTVDFYGDLVRGAFVNQRAAQIIGVNDAHLTYGAGTGTVAIIDTGVDTNHPALWRALAPGYDFTRDRADTVSELLDLNQSTVAILDQSAVVLASSKIIPVALGQSTVVILDQSTVAILDADNLPAAFGHGTMVAGLVHLVAPSARIMPLKAFRADGSATLSDIIRAIRYAADQGADVISMSFSMPSNSPELSDAISYARQKGAVCVASVGNSGAEKKVYPAALGYVIGVGSTNSSDRRSPFSNYGSAARIAAPGEALLTTFPGNNYAGVWGTSFSAALVAGAVDLLYQVDSRLRFEGAKLALDHGKEIEQKMGEARLDLVRSLAYSQSH